MEQIEVPVSPGELLDKITILEIKSERIDDAAKLANVRLELSILSETWNNLIPPDGTIERIHAELKRINEALWSIEDDIREKEQAGEFDSRFIELARAVYVTNDQRAAAKKELNIYLDSDIVEEKSRFLLRADVPGVSPGDIDVSMDAGVLTVSGERHADERSEDDGVRRTERSTGRFFRRFTLPDTADAESITARSQNGILEVAIPKLPAVQARRIAVEAA